MYCQQHDTLGGRTDLAAHAAYLASRLICVVGEIHIIECKKLSSLPLPLRLLQFVPESLPTFRADVQAMFGRYLPGQGIVCDMVGMAGSADIDQAAFASVRRPRFHASRLTREMAFLWLCVRTLFSVRKADCDLIQVRDMVSISLLGVIVARLKGIPFAYWMSFLMSEGRIERATEQIRAGAGLRSRLVLLKGRIEKALLYKFILPRSRHIFVQSDAMRVFLMERGIAAGKITAVPMGVDMAFQPDEVVRQRPADWSDVPLIAYLGTLDKARDIPRLIDTLCLVRHAQPQACLLLIGDSPNRVDTEQLRTYCAKLGLQEHVHITGWLPKTQAWSLLAAADVAVSYIPRGPLYDVSSPTKLLEYLALGVPCVGNDNPDQEAVLARSAAGWLSGSSVEALAAALTEVLADPAAAREKASRGPDFISSVRSYQILAEQLALVYRQFLPSMS